MIIAQTSKIVAITPPGAILDNTSPTTAAVDTAGFAYAVITVFLGALDIAMTALKLQQSNASGSGFADITGTVGGTDFTLPIATDDNKFVKFFVDLRGKKRYLDLVATVGDGAAGTYFAAWAELYEGSTTPSNATDRGLLAQVIV
jgi:hypothetical protein